MCLKLSIELMTEIITSETYNLINFWKIDDENMRTKINAKLEKD